MRAMQLISLVAIVGMTGDFVAEMVAADSRPPDVLIGTLVVACLATLYVIISYILYWDSMLPMLIASATDIGLMVAVIVVAVTLGKPLSFLSCKDLSAGGGSNASFIASIGKNIVEATGADGRVNYYVWVGAAQKSCYATKAVWGLSIALCVLFALSGVASICLWRRQKMAAPKDCEGQ
ncbi:hypothetical protein F5X68DRAFT_215890 [Plectosphaerella plurivora]|uniref:MARVEL domain-containing protein n=1 Tax=Plectosphaerella plurivora TaxID=936078 RepID=A0A9P8V2W8_9PEZI|nr:hypothetical protein F5X68DRAFT_215890 [Plectosphaerella plurivora]